MGAGSYQQCCIRGSAACTLLYRTHRSPDACQVIPQIGVNWQSSVESAQQHQLLLAEVCFSLVAWAFCLRLRQKMSLLPLNLPSPSVLCPKATKLFTLHTEISLYFTAVFNCKVKWPTPLFDQVVLLKQDSICMGGGGRRYVHPHYQTLSKRQSSFPDCFQPSWQGRPMAAFLVINKALCFCNVNCLQQPSLSSQGCRSPAFNSLHVARALSKDILYVGRDSFVCRSQIPCAHALMGSGISRQAGLLGAHLQRDVDCFNW